MGWDCNSGQQCPTTKTSHQISSPTRKSLAVQKWCQFASTTARSQPCTFILILSLQAPAVKESTHFHFGAHTDGMVLSQVMQSRDSAQGQGNAAIWWLSHLSHVPSHPSHTMHALVHWQKSSMCGHNCQIESLCTLDFC